MEDAPSPMSHRIPRRLRAGWSVKRLLTTAISPAASKSKPPSDTTSSFCCSPSPFASFPDETWDADAADPGSAYSQVFDISQQIDVDEREDSFDSSSGPTSSILSDPSSPTSSTFLASSSDSRTSSESALVSPPRLLPPIPPIAQSPECRRVRALPIPPLPHPSEAPLRPKRVGQLQLQTSLIHTVTEDCDSPIIPATAVVAPTRNMIRGVSTATSYRREGGDAGEIDWMLLEELLGASDVGL